jgi:two-component system heavy metal sensor histidine kinase CusS
VKAIAEMHRGSVSARSANGVNTFAFSIAASRAQSVAPPVRSAAGANVDAKSGANVTDTPEPGAGAYSSLVKGKSA